MKYVYFIHARETCHFKIGISENPSGRLANMQRENPQTLDLIAMLPVETLTERKEALAVERRFHERYLRSHHRGEWFHADTLIWQDAAAINAGIFDLALLPEIVTEASLLRPVSRGPRVKSAPLPDVGVAA